MPDQQVTIQLGTFPEGYCWTGPQQFAQDLVNLLLLTVPSSAGVVIGPDVPAPEQQGMLWARTVGGYLEGVYLYLGGWFRPHPSPPSGAERRLWVGTEDAVGLWSYDGGDGNDPGVVVPSDTIGAMWQVDHLFDFRIPMGPGTGSVYDGNPARTLGVAANLGAEKVALASGQNAPHSHFLMNTDEGEVQSGPFPNTGNHLCQKGSHSSFSTEYVLTASSTTPNVALSGEAGSADAHENLPPVRGAFVIKRTARKFISAV